LALETGARAGAAVGVRLRPAVRAGWLARCAAGVVLRTGLRSGAVTTTGPRVSGLFSVSAIALPIPGADRKARTPSGTIEARNQCLIAPRGCEGFGACERCRKTSFGTTRPGAKTPTFRKFDMKTMVRRRTQNPSPRSPLHLLFAPGADATSYSCHIGAPRPTRSRVTMTGSRFPGSRVAASDHLPRDVSVPSGIYGRRLSAYSCGGSRGFVHEHARTAFPWLALAGTTNGNGRIWP
jgi:hypothetical protein